ncbi:MAG: GGDEF domain-containing protein [Burkholderiales bacterium]
MRYPDTPERSGELLRLALPLMSKHGSAYHPISYAIWYQHVSYRIPELNAELSGFIENGGKLTEDTTHRLYQQHVAGAAERGIARVNGDVDRMLGDVAGSMAITHGKTSEYASTLEAFVSTLSSDFAVSDEIRDRIGSVLKATKDTGDFVNLLCSMIEDRRREVIRLREELERTRDEALQDALTGISNRRGFVASLEGLSAQSVRDRSELCLLMVDIDRFKNINDTYGHLFGDRVIRSVAQTLQASVKGRDVAARYGGEEFAVLLPTTPIKGAVALAEAIRAQIEKTKIKRLDKDESVEGITVSIGSTVYRPNEPLAEFINRADKALYAAKSAGRNRVNTQ